MTRNCFSRADLHLTLRGYELLAQMSQRTGPEHLGPEFKESALEKARSARASVLFLEHASLALVKLANLRSEGLMVHRAVIVLWLASAMGGYANAVPAPSATASDRERLESHVRYLSQPSLKGRKPGSFGSRSARHYVQDKFRDYGLVPWGRAKSYENSFGYGKNIVGFLPGSDAKLADQIVLVSAHYDHLGRDRNGRICPGAADNASGVAALLETARQMGSLESRPKRSLLFVAFDCEEMMLFGSFAFSCQQDVRDANIAAALNIDMLGRDFFDVVRHSLLVAGAEQYPNTRAALFRMGARAGIRVFPLGTDLIGPRSDHVAFESRNIPCLFFSCGTFKDYHQPGDTAEKLNYEDLERSANVIFETVKRVSDVGAIEPAAAPESGYVDELKAVRLVMSEVNKNSAAAGIKADDLGAFQKLADEVEALSNAANYDRQARERLIVDASGILAPYFLSELTGGIKQTAEGQKASRLAMQYLQNMWPLCRARNKGYFL